MIDKKKQRHHELKDAAYIETKWIEPMHIKVEPVIDVQHKPRAYHDSDAKFTAKRENKKTHQHNFRHQQTLRVHESKRGE